MRRRYSNTERRFRNPVNYLWWQPNTATEGAPDKPFPGEHQWMNFDVGSNDLPDLLNVAALSFDTPEQTRYGSVSAGAVWEESPDNVGQKVPLNARLLYTTGKVHVSMQVGETILARLAIFDLPSTLQTAANSAKPAAVTNSDFASWFWANDTSVQGWLGQRRPRQPYVPLWWRDVIMVPRRGGDAIQGIAARTFQVKIRHPTGNVRNSDSSAMALVLGTRSRGGSTYPLGMDVMTLLKTSYVV